MSTTEAIEAPAPLAATPKPAVRRPVDAATLVLLDRAARKPRVLMGQRNQRQVFMPGKFVFPGGRVDPSDRAMPVFGMLEGESERRLGIRVGRPSASRARALALAAIRETFEETGLIIGTRELGIPKVPAGWQAFAEAEVFPNLEALSFVARAITPPGRLRRFDTRFFMADVRDVAHRIEGVVGPDSELVELRWLTFEEARGVDLPGITRAILGEIEGRLAAGASPRLPVPFYFERSGKRYRELLD
ncbi:NUDIX domain-containing protein [Bosea sp. 117]|uniref:NUDIX hydrolase n=1 Tax=Bosea sp. 117 TaxID=1125973 RepID=UPI00049497DC|nr:NUDIX domain-containing protein [Bosea sp. 117]